MALQDCRACFVAEAQSYLFISCLQHQKTAGIDSVNAPTARAQPAIRVLGETDPARNARRVRLRQEQSCCQLPPCLPTRLPCETTDDRYACEKAPGHPAPWSPQSVSLFRRKKFPSVERRDLVLCGLGIFRPGWAHLTTIEHGGAVLRSLDTAI